jgi:hypothetical protein
MSDQMPVSDLTPPAGAQPWTCPRCGRENKAAWQQCPGCESDRAGRLPGDREPAVPRKRANPVNLVLGLLVLAALVALVVLYAPAVAEWVAEQWTTFVTWVDERT